jgi:ABC-type branched-subunit amino acid transport system ATPase component
MSVVLEIEDLRAGYGDHEILRGVGLHVDAGEIVAIIGPNGAGKSTLLKTIAGLLAPRGGELRFRGERIGGAAPHAIIRRGLCYVPQEANVFAGLSVTENLLIGGWAAPARRADRVAAITDLFPVLAERRRQRAGSLSGGERQMLAIAMALMVEPVLLLLDEPSAGLAPALQRLIFDRIRDINNSRGVAIVLVEQNARESLTLCRRGYVLVMGQTRAEGSSAALLEDPEIRRLYLGG